MKVVSILNKNNDYQRFEVLKHNRNKRYKYNQPELFTTLPRMLLKAT